MAGKDWGSIQSGRKDDSSARGAGSSDEFFDNVDSTSQQLQSASKTLAQTVARTQQAQAAQSAQAKQNNAPTLGGNGGDSEDE